MKYLQNINYLQEQMTQKENEKNRTLIQYTNRSYFSSLRVVSVSNEFVK